MLRHYGHRNPRLPSVVRFPFDFCRAFVSGSPVEAFRYISTFIPCNLGKETTADYRTRLLNRDVLSRCETVPMFDKQPGLVGFAAKSSGPHQDPRTVQLFAMQRKFEVSLLERSYDVVALRDPCSTVPDHDGSTPVLHLHNSKSHPPFFAAAASLLPSAYN